MLRLISPLGEDLEIGDAKVNFEVINNLFSDNVITAPLTLDFNIPNSDNNKKILGFPNTITTRGKTNKTLPGWKYLLGNRYFIVELNIKSSNEKNIRINVQASSSKIVALQEKSITSFDYGSYNHTTNPIAYMNSVILGTHANYPYVYGPVQNEDALIGNITGIINAYDPATNTFLGSTSGADYRICPFVYLRFVLNKIASLSNLELDGDFVDDEEINTLVLYNAATKLASYTGLDRLYRIEKHLPSLTVKELLDSLKKMFCLFINVNPNNNKLEIKSAKKILSNQEYIDWTDKIIKDPETDWEGLNVGGYKLKQTRDTADRWQRLGDDKFEYIYDEGEEEIETKFDRPDTNNYSATSIGAFNWRTPIVAQEIETFQYLVTYPTPANPNYLVAGFGPRLMFYRGLQNDSLGRLYPMLSTDNVDYSLTPIANYSLEYSGSYGLVEVWWKKYLETMDNTKPLKAKFHLNVVDLMDLKLDIKRKIFSSYFFIKELKYTATNKYIGIAEVELIKTY